MSLAEYMTPSEEIVNALSDLEIYFQLLKQEDVSLFMEKGRKREYSGTFQEYFRLQDMEEFFNLNKHKPWDTLLKTIYLLKRFSTNFDVSKLMPLTNEETDEVVRILKKGQTSRLILNSWMTPLSKGDAIDAIYDANKVTVSGTERAQFQILKLANLLTDSSEDVGLYTHVLEITSPDELILYFKTQEIAPRDSLILTYQRGLSADFKFTFYMFLIYKNALYSVSNPEHRLNLDNTAGMRSPQRYLERKYKNVWLPISYILNYMEGKIKDTNPLMVKGTKVLKILSMDELKENMPEAIYWLSMFLFKVIDCILSEEVKRGITPQGAQDLLALINKADDRKLKVHTSQADAGGYLAKKYNDTIDALAIVEDRLPEIIGDEEYITNLINYRRRQRYARVIRQRARADHAENYQRVFDWFVEFVKSHEMLTIAKRALEDKMYARMFYHDFGSVSWEFPGQEEGLGKEKIFSIDKAIFTRGATRKDVEFNWTGDGTLHDDKVWRQFHDEVKARISCPFCTKSRWKSILKIQFCDYRQISEFFEVAPEDLPKEMVEHFHQQNDAYVGNAILSDTDPVDELLDPWFRHHYTDNVYNEDTKEWEQVIAASRDKKYLAFYIPICNRCLKKYQRQLGIEVKVKEKKERRVVTLSQLEDEDNGWAYKHETHYSFESDKRHFFVDGLSLCGRVEMFATNRAAKDKNDDEYDNCTLCLKSLKRIRREGK